MYYTLIVVCFVGFVCGSDEDLRIIDSIYPEEKCSSSGGICTIAADCPKDKLSAEQGLCPQQRSRGVECCYAVSNKETRCNKRGGECMEECRQDRILPGAEDCPADFECCTLVY